MSEYCHRKAVRMKISEEEACKIFNVNDSWDIAELLEKTEFEIAPTREFFIDYKLPCSNDAEGDWGKVRTLNMTEFLKYAPEFCELLNHRGIDKSELRLVEYCWYDCSEAPDYFDESTYHDYFYDEVQLKSYFIKEEV